MDWNQFVARRRTALLKLNSQGDARRAETPGAQSACERAESLRFLKEEGSDGGDGSEAGRHRGGARKAGEALGIGDGNETAGTALDAFGGVTAFLAQGDAHVAIDVGRLLVTVGSGVTSLELAVVGLGGVWNFARLLHESHKKELGAIIIVGG
jgi:hypothetical protein